MRILLETLFRLVDSNKLKKLLCPLVGLIFRFVGMKKDYLNNLVADSVNRVKARHGILEND